MRACLCTRLTVVRTSLRSAAKTVIGAWTPSDTILVDVRHRDNARDCVSRMVSHALRGTLEGFCNRCGRMRWEWVLSIGSEWGLVETGYTPRSFKRVVICNSILVTSWPVFYVMVGWHDASA